MKKKVVFGSEIREKIAGSIPAGFGTKEQALASIDRWQKGEKPRSPLDHGCFAMYDKVAKDLLEFEIRERGAEPQKE